MIRPVALWIAAFLAAGAAHAAESPGLVFDDGFEPGCPGPGPGVTTGTGAALLLRGTVVSPANVFAGEVLVVGDTIACAGTSCAGQPGASTATVVETGGIIYPGLIDSNTVVLFNAFDQNDWAPQAVYANPADWFNDTRYLALVDAKQYLSGEGPGSVDLACELDKYGELKGLIAGTTSIVGNPGASSRACYGSLARTLDQTANDLGADKIQTALSFPTTVSADGVCANFLDGDTDAYLVHIAEGTNTAARNQFLNLNTVTSVDGCLYAPQTAIVHGTALTDPELTTMASAGMNLLWTPRSDVALYAASANVPLARTKGINVALGTNWSITGSQNLLDEMRAADQYDNANWGDTLAPSDLVRMVTDRAATVLGLQDVLGSIAVGRKADLTVIAGDCAAPYASLLRARPAQVRLVVVGGVPLYGDATLLAAAPTTPGCEALDVCGKSKFACVAESGDTLSNKFGQTLAEIVTALSNGISTYDALNLTQYKFAPIAPLVACP